MPPGLSNIWKKANKQTVCYILAKKASGTTDKVEMEAFFCYMEAYA
ncbi:hypothetical protein GCM10020370_66170 [Paenibacillus hodogayensis]